MKEQDRIYKNKLLKEVVLEQLDLKVFGPLPFYEDIPKEETITLFMMGVSTNKGRVEEIYTRQDFDIVKRILKIELGDYYNEINYDWKEEEGRLDFYLKLDRYKNILTRFWSLGIKQGTLDKVG